MGSKKRPATGGAVRIARTVSSSLEVKVSFSLVSSKRESRLPVEENNEDLSGLSKPEFKGAVGMTIRRSFGFLVQIKGTGEPG